MDDEERNLANYIAAALVRSNGYAARIEIDRIIAAVSSDPKRLEPFGFKVYSQGDEDGILEEIFKRLKIDQGVFCEALAVQLRDEIAAALELDASGVHVSLRQKARGGITITASV